MRANATNQDNNEAMQNSECIPKHTTTGGKGSANQHGTGEYGPTGGPHTQVGLEAQGVHRLHVLVARLLKEALLEEHAA